MIAPVLILALILPGIASAGVITFEGVEDVVPNGYGGLSWSNWGGMNATTYGGNPSGYQAGRVSGDYVVYNRVQIRRNSTPPRRSRLPASISRPPGMTDCRSISPAT